MKLIVDTNVFIAALISDTGASREVLRRCLSRRYQPFMSLVLFAEYRDVMSRDDLFARSLLSAEERRALLAAYLSVCRRTEIYYLWRPNLPDEGDNHVVELAVAAGANAIVTHNVTDFARAELRFPALRVLTPAQVLMMKEDD
jgi:putative PIN family toxin of toxin-antitoxin system